MNRFFARPVILLIAIVSLVLTHELSLTKADEKPSETKLEPGFVSLFDGKTLNGWEGNTKLWTVEDGAITGEINGKDKTTPGNTFLISKQGNVTDFELRLTYRIVGHNSGIQYRGKILDQKNFVVGGYQADLEAGMPNNKGVREDVFSGMNYDERGRGPLAQRGERTTIDNDGKVIQREKIGDFKELAKKLKVDDWNDYVVIAVGNKLQHFINGQLMSEVIDDQEAKRAMSGVLAFQLHAGPPMKVQFKDIRISTIRLRSRTAANNTSTTAAKPATELEPGFKSIFNGKTLDGWNGNPDLWRVENGSIIGETVADKALKRNSFLIWEQGEVDDFELRFQYKLRNFNTGIQYRSRVLNAKEWVVGGYQCDLVGADEGDYNGLCWDEAGSRGVLAQRSERTTVKKKNDKEDEIVQREPVGNKAELGKVVKLDDWNDVAIVCQGNKMQHYINGKLMCEILDEQVDKRNLSGILALQVHAGPPMKVEFKNIRLKRLKLAPVEPVGKRAKLVMVAGKPSHGPGAHEFNAGSILLKKCLSEGMPQIVTSIYKDGWPADPTAFDNADAIMLYMDGGDGHPVVQKNRLAEIDYLMKKGVGLVCTHYAVEVPTERGGPDFLKWIGGYFEENWSVNPHWTAEIMDLPKHPIASGVEKFKMHDEWYFHMRFVPEMKSVTPILTAVPTPDTMKRKDGPHEGNPTVRAAVKDKVPQHLAWAYERADGGRGFGYTGAHNHSNWGDDNNRKLFLNALVWTCKLDVPADGVKSTVTEEDLQKNLDEKGQRKKR